MRGTILFGLCMLGKAINSDLFADAWMRAGMTLVIVCLYIIDAGEYGREWLPRVEWLIEKIKKGWWKNEGFTSQNNTTQRSKLL